MAKRVNKRFLIILTAVVMGVLIGGVAVTQFAGRGNAQKFIAEGDALFAAGDYAKAIEAYKRAARTKSERGNNALALKMGDTYHQLARYDSDAIGKDLATWEGILEASPRNVESLRRVVDALIDLTELRPQPEYYVRLQERAQRLAELDPSNNKAKAYAQIAVLGAWMGGKATDDAEIERAVAVLWEMVSAQVDEPAAAWYVARTSLKRAQDYFGTNDFAQSKQHRDRALAIYDDALKSFPDSPALLYRYYAVRITVLEMDRRDPTIAHAPDEPNAATDPATIEVLNKAQSLVTAKDKDYVDIRLRWAESLLQNKQGEEAEKELLSLMEELPNDMRVRLEASRLLRMQPGKRDKAIEILARPQGDDPTLTGFRAYLKPSFEYRRITDLLELRLDAYSEANEDEKAAMKPLIDELFARVSSVSSQTDARFLKLKGKMLLLMNPTDHNSQIEAVTVLQQAVNQMEQQRQVDPELLFTLSRTYAAIGETGQAASLLNQLLEARPGLVLVRKELIRILLRTGQIEVATRHLDLLEKNLPDDADVKRMRVAVLASNGKTEQITQIVAKLPEETDQEKLYKARSALVAGQDDMAEKLLKGVSDAELQGEGKSIAATQLLARLYLKHNRKDEAKQLIAAGLQKDQNNRWMKVLELVADGRATPKEIQEINEDAIEGIENPVVRAMQGYRMLREQGRLDEALKLLQQAEADNLGGEATEMIFSHAIEMRDWPLAEEYANKLSKLDWDRAGGLYYRTRLEVSRGDDRDAALRSARELTNKLGEFSRSWVLLGQVQQSLGQHEAALGSFNTALERQLDNVEALRGVIECHLALRQLASARQYIGQGMRHPMAGTFFKEMSKRVEEQYGDPRTVTEEREKDINSNPDSLQVWLALTENYIRVADNFTTKNDGQNARVYYEKAESRLLEAMNKWPDEALLYGRFADLEVRLGKPDDALQKLQLLSGMEKWKGRPEPQQMLAALYLRLGDKYYPQAEVALQEAERFSSDPAAIRQQLVQFYLRTDQKEKAIRLLTEQVAKTGDGQLHKQLIEMQVLAGQNDQADQQLETALQAAPNDVKLLSLRAYLRMMQQNLPEAMTFAQRAIKLDPQYAPGYYYRGMIKLRQGEVNDALLDLQKARDLSPSNADIRTGLVDVYVYRKQLDNAIREMEVAVQYAPDRRDLKLRVARLLASAERWTALESLLAQVKSDPQFSQDPMWWQVEAQMWSDRGDASRALTAVQVAIKMQPNEPTAVRLFLEILSKAGQYDQVIAITDELVAQQQVQRPWWMHNLRGLAYGKLKQIQKAEGEFDRAMASADEESDTAAPAAVARAMAEVLGTEVTAKKLQPRVKPMWLVELANVYALKQQWPEALQVADRLMDQELPGLPLSLRLHAIRSAGRIYTTTVGMNSESSAKAERAYLAFLADAEKSRNDPGLELEALNNLACLFADHPSSPDPAKALVYSKRAYKIMTEMDSFDPNIVDTHGWVLLLCNRVDEGLELLQTAVSSESAPPDAYYHLGEAYLKKKEIDRAASQFELAGARIKTLRDRGIFVDPVLEKKIQQAAEQARQSN